MLKPDSLRAALTAAVPYVAQNPDCLHIFIDEGAIVSTLAPFLSFEYQYTLNLVITDYADSADPLVVAILRWLRSHQPDIMANPDKRDKGFTFAVDFLDNAMRDISLTLRLTERVIVREDGGSLTVSHVDEPAPPPSDLSEVEIWLAGRKVAARRTLMREIAKTLRQRQKKQIQAQKNPDGSPYIPRKRRVRDQHGYLRRTMFTRLHSARFMKTASTPESASVSFTSTVEHLTRVHHDGLRDRISRHGPTVRYARRQLLGFTNADRDRIADLALAHLARLAAL